MKPYYFPLILLFITLFSCQNSSDKSENREPLSDSTSITGLTGDSVKLVKTGSINFKVKSVEESTKVVSVLAHKYGGMIYYQNFQSVEGGRKELKASDDSLLVISTITPVADITVRIPSQHLETFLFDVADVGYYTDNSQMKIDDKSLLHLENMLKQKNREDAVRSTQMKHDSSTTFKKIEVKDEAIQQFIANKAIDSDAAYSNVSLNLFQNALVSKEMIANYDLSDYQLPFGERLGNSFSDGWKAFLNFLLAVLHLWVFVLLFLIVFLSYRYYQYKRKIGGLAKP